MTEDAKSLRKLRAEWDELREMHDALREQYFQAKKEAESYKAQLALREETMEEYDASVQKEIREWKEKCDTKQKEVNQLRKLIEGQEPVSSEEVETLRNRVDALSGELKKAQSQVKELEEQLAECSNQPEEVSYHHDADIGKISQLEEEKNMILEQATKLERRVSELTEEMEETKEACDRLVNDNKRLTNESCELIDRLNAMEKELHEAQHPAVQHAKRGNNIYAEIADNNEVLKADLLKLWKENQQLMHTTANLRRELNRERDRALLNANFTCVRQQSCSACGDLTLSLKRAQELARTQSQLVETLLQRRISELDCLIKKNSQEGIRRFYAELSQLKIQVESRFSTLEELRHQHDDDTVLIAELKKKAGGFELDLKNALAMEKQLKTRLEREKAIHEKEIAEYVEQLANRGRGNSKCSSTVEKKMTEETVVVKKEGGNLALDVYAKLENINKENENIPIAATEAAAVEIQEMDEEDSAGPTPLKKSRTSTNKVAARETPATSSRLDIYGGSLQKNVRFGSAQSTQRKEGSIRRRRLQERFKQADHEPLNVSFGELERKMAEKQAVKERAEKERLERIEAEEKMEIQSLPTAAETHEDS